MVRQRVDNSVLADYLANGNLVYVKTYATRKLATFYVSKGKREYQVSQEVDVEKLGEMCVQAGLAFVEKSENGVVTYRKERPKF